MTHTLVLCLALGLFATAPKAQTGTAQSGLKKSLSAKPAAPTRILFLGSAHFSQRQFYAAGAAADLLSEGRQKEVAGINRQLAAYKPDLILIEQEPENQDALDSLYAAYRAGGLSLTDLEYGRAERYQFGFALAKRLGHPQVLGADCYESVSSRMLTSGDNLASFVAAMDSFSAVGKKVDRRFAEGRLSLKDYLSFLNSAPVLEQAYQAMFVNPLRVRNGGFTNPNAAYVDTAHVSKTYIGAGYVSVFLERELKIYSNIVAAQARQNAKRILVVMGHRHAAVLPKLMMHDPAFAWVPLATYLK